MVGIPKKIVLSLILCMCVMMQAFAFDIPERPNPPRYVNDFAGFLQEGDVARLEKKLKRYNDTTSTAIFIVVLDDVGHYEASDLSVRIGEKWGGGQDGKDNGVVILMTNVRGRAGERDIDVATGRGVDVAIPDILMHRIVQNEVIPRFKQDKYFSGLNHLTDLIFGLLAGEFSAEDLVRQRSTEGEIPPIVVIALFFLIVFIMIKFSQNNDDVDYNRRGAKRTAHGGPIVISRRGGGWGGFTGGFGGGGFGGGSGGGGGFGGFGGGSFGGGGAGGSW